MSMASIRKHYHVPACRGGLVEFQGNLCRITSSDQTDEHLWIYDLRMPQLRMKVHPAWEMRYLVCANAVEDADGDLDACGRPAVGYRIDTEFGARYEVCREHHVPPFERCTWRWGETAADTHCKVHGGAQQDDTDWCTEAFEATL